MFSAAVAAVESRSVIFTLQRLGDAGAKLAVD